MSGENIALEAATGQRGAAAGGETLHIQHDL